MSRSPSPPQAAAVHHGGGNYLDRIRIDISESHASLDRHVSTKRSVRKSRVGNVLRVLVAAVLIRLRLREPLVMSGFCRRWLDDFVTYWQDILGGRPIPTVSDFNALLYEYRRRQQHVEELSWGDAAQHVANWQDPDAIYLTFHNARRLALNPLAGLRLWRLVRRGSRVLEYGCSLAPYYYCYRHYFSHLGCSFVLADIPNFYIKSEGHGLDHPNALRTRQAALSTILGETAVVYGDVDDLDESIGFCVARKVG